VSLGAKVVVRCGVATPFVTDEGNWIVDCDFGPIDDAARLSAVLHERAGIVEHGFFIGLAHDVLVATNTGVDHRTRP
jgi:ribose 5-phosphate isomerase A